MVLVNKTYNKMLEEIGFEGAVIEETISPRNDPECFKRIKIYKTGSMFLNSKYLQSIYDTSGTNYDSYAFKTIANEAVSNAVQRGNKGKEDLEIKIGVAKGSRGAVLRVEDSGKGFDYRTRTRKFEQGGAGIDTLNMRGIEAGYEGKGNILNIKFMNKN
jgi:hypothetical protein